MEGDEQRRRQYEQQNYPRGYAPDYGAPGTNVPNVQQIRAGQGGDNPDRFRQGQLLTTRSSTTTPLATSAGVPQDLGSFAYGQAHQYQAAPTQATTFQYQPEFLQDPQRQRFQQYPAQMMYNVPQQTQTQSPYDPVGQYQRRQTAAVEVSSSQLGVSPHYYSTGEIPTASTPAAMLQGYSTTAYQQSMQYNAPNALGRSTLASPYSAMPPDFAQTGSAEGPEQQEQEIDIAAENNDRYYRAIGETNHSTSMGMLVEAGDSLLQVSDWLLTNAVRLGRLISREDYFPTTNLPRVFERRSGNARPTGHALGQFQHKLACAPPAPIG